MTYKHLKSLDKEKLLKKSFSFLGGYAFSARLSHFVHNDGAENALPLAK